MQKLQARARTWSLGVRPGAPLSPGLMQYRRAASARGSHDSAADFGRLPQRERRLPGDAAGPGELRRQAALRAHPLRDCLDEDLADRGRVADLVSDAAGRARYIAQRGEVALLAEHEDDELDLLARVVQRAELLQQRTERQVIA